MDELAKNLAKTRYEKAKTCITAAELLMTINDYNTVVNRTYYAIFHAMRSILALERKDFEKHSAVISYFRKNYIKTQIIPVIASDIIGNAFNMRNDSDYKDFYVISKEEAEDSLNEAKQFLDITGEYLARFDIF